MKKSIPSIIALAFVAGLLYIPSAAAQDPELSPITIAVPTEISGTVLEPGEYRLQVMPTLTHRNLVRVYSADGQHITTVLTVPRRLDPLESRPAAEFVFYPATAEHPQALRTWIAAAPPGNIGHDFVYAEGRARVFAAEASAPVVTYRTTTETADLGEADLYVVTPDQRIETYVVPETRVETRVTTTTPETRTTFVEERTEVAGLREQLPRTAGSMPLLALLGLLSVAGAATFRFMNR
jgi:hypothetical protein